MHDQSRAVCSGAYPNRAFSDAPDTVSEQERAPRQRLGAVADDFAVGRGSGPILNARRDREFLPGEARACGADGRRREPAGPRASASLHRERVRS